MKKLDFIKALEHHTLLYGETNTKKTLITAEFVKFLIEMSNIEPIMITILDFAPQFKAFKKFKIGGRIKDFYGKSIECNYIPLKGDIIPPRLNANSKKDLYEKICQNYKLTSEILQNYSQNPTPFLIINDISIYLHLGSKHNLLEIIQKSSTFFGNSYYGDSIKSKIPSLISIIERKRVEFLINNIEYSLCTGN
jgi:hypothetical protein